MITKLNASGLLRQLDEEVIVSYESGMKDVGLIVTDLLAFQRKDTPVTEGTIEVTGNTSVSVRNRSIYQALIELHNSIGGYIEVDINRKLNWLLDIGEDKGQQIRYGKNLMYVTREIYYNEQATKLHIEGGEEDLDDIVVVDSEANKDEDVSYGYLILPEEYAAYYGYTGEGDALHRDVGIFRPAGSMQYISPDEAESELVSTTFHNSWLYDYLSIDGDLGTRTYFIPSGLTNNWTDYLYFTFYGSPPLSQIRIYTDGFQYNEFDAILIDILETGNTEWTLNAASKTLVSPENYTGMWCGINFTERHVDRIRIKFRWSGIVSDWFFLHELEGGLDYYDETDNFVQGSDDRTLRCDIGDYQSAETYYINYRHAAYLVAWDAIPTYGWIARTIANRYNNQTVSLIEAGRVTLTELKTPPVSYAIQIVDISNTNPFEYLVLGSIVRVIDDELGVVEARIVSLTRDLTDPAKISLEVSTFRRDLFNIINTLSRRIG